jgi:5'-3' exonuclease
MKDIYLVDGTYELFRHYFAVPSAEDASGQEIGACRGVISSVLSILEKKSLYVGVATDRIIESFRNDLYDGYKTGEGIDPALYSQFPILEDALEKMGVKLWPMVEFEADDALAAAAHKADADSSVNRVYICTPDKDLCQCVKNDRVVELDRRRDIVIDEAGVIAKFGVPPESIPDYLALVGDSADGYPGIKGWGAKTVAKVLSIYKHLEEIPDEASKWNKDISGYPKLAQTIAANRADAMLFRQLATLRLDVPVFDSVEDLRWKGPTPEFEAVCKRLNADSIYKRTLALAEKL